MTEAAKSPVERIHRRIDCALEIVVVRLSETGFYRGCTLNLSQGGTGAFFTRAPFLEHEFVTFRISEGPRGFPCLAGEAEVRWRQDDAQRASLGLRFCRLTVGDKAILERMIVLHSSPGPIPLKP